MTTKTTIELVMEAVANSDQVTLEDMERMDIREKIVLKELEEGNFCPICMLGLNDNHGKCGDKSELDKIMRSRELGSNRDVIDTIEKIYNNPVASIEAITFISTMDVNKILQLAIKAAKENLIFRALLITKLENL